MIAGGTTESIGVLAGQQRLAAVLSPVRRRLLENLQSPDSATGLARKLGLPRQKINYHIRKLEAAGLVELAEEKARRGCTERYVRLTARAFVISPEFLKGLAADPEQLRDKYSSAYLVAMAGRAVRDVAILRERAEKAAERLATMALETEISFGSPVDFQAFSEELTVHVLQLAVKYNRSNLKSSRRFRLFAGSHPIITKDQNHSLVSDPDTAAKKEKP
jgi:DNA-binding transcriptional ArsR family regulator